MMRAPADLERHAHQLQERRFVLEVVRADRLALGIERVEGADDAERAQRDDEGRHLQPRHQRAVEIAEDDAAEQPGGKATISGMPSMTASRPITTEEITIITPTERSMPAVRITRVCAMPRMPMIVTWVSTVETLLPVTKCDVD